MMLYKSKNCFKTGLAAMECLQLIICCDVKFNFLGFSFRGGSQTFRRALWRQPHYSHYFCCQNNCSNIFKYIVACFQSIKTCVFRRSFADRSSTITLGRKNGRTNGGNGNLSNSKKLRAWQKQIFQESLT